ncbi:hypothetical protein HNR07_001547 [Nocardiopsis metallicus]|uniref:Uncharacterized protein n=1 Tax=Nocardiopsis metallicus TaxID=179819 RepID=A0A840W0S4_9ACTN|nr:hypothetical protein [Nocardiopsis metallicus]
MSTIENPTPPPRSVPRELIAFTARASGEPT